MTAIWSQEALLQTLTKFRDGSAVRAAIDLLAKRKPQFFYTSHFERMSGEVSLNKLASDKQNNSVRALAFYLFNNKVGRVKGSMYISKNQSFHWCLSAFSGSGGLRAYSFFNEQDRKTVLYGESELARGAGQSVGLFLCEFAVAFGAGKK